ncbi:ubiquitin/ISG15-conjugating enzyme E2 L6 isoform X1 [Marmota marmota marmota]|uniref:ubiquitin/ISG15-conjugating enzyme E2 L6 isoform X1 n=3 Tax=Marmota TaxID=9992 RepID=UPI00209251BC|nr:ubiquitin/ISG15-conjugating enzyme E2 L6 isoform X1 [Marmota marmota marmota]
MARGPGRGQSVLSTSPSASLRSRWEQVYTAWNGTKWSGSWAGLGRCGPWGGAHGVRARGSSPDRARGRPRFRAKMTASKRVAKEMEDLQQELPPYLKHLYCDDANVLVWHALLLPAESHGVSQRLAFAEAGFELAILLPQPPELLRLQHQPPYNLKAFNLRIDFSKEYPFKPPTVKFTTKIYHPNVSESGEVCVPLLSKENWNPYIKICQVLEALNMLVDKPNPREPLRVELADLLLQDPELFRKKAEEFTLEFGIDRPS